ncbi:MAG: hypothetical protein AAF530_10540 [Pseudomonadota bacterium]
MPQILSTANTRWAAAFSVMITIVAAVLGYYYDKFWWPPDEGAYAYVAQRVLAGDVLNGDVQDIHMGYVNILNAIALALFGEQLVSLRIPLVIAGLLQACILFYVFRCKGPIAGLLASVTLTCLSFVQFLNPTAHWYSLFLLIAIIAWLSWKIEDTPRQLFVVGLLVTTLFLFRQLSGVIAGIGILSYLLFRMPRGPGGSDAYLARILMLTMVAGLCGYLLAKTSFVTMLVFGSWPILILLIGTMHATVSNRVLLPRLAAMSAGGLAAVAPLLMYHIHYGSLETWFHDTIVTAFALTNLAFFDAPSYFAYIKFSIFSLLDPGFFEVALNNIYWVLLLLAAPLLGFLLLKRLLNEMRNNFTLHPLPYIAVFYSLISLHYQIPIYLFYTVGITLCGLLFLLYQPRANLRSSMLVGTLIFLSVMGLYYHAAQPLTRGLVATLKGERIALSSQRLPSPVGLSIQAEDHIVYQKISELVEDNVAPGQSILAIPANPEIYFITGRKAPVRFFNSAIGIVDNQELKGIIGTLKTNSPRLVFYRPDDKYNTPFGDQVMSFVRTRYELIDTFSGFEVYRKIETTAQSRS